MGQDRFYPSYFPGDLPGCYTGQVIILDIKDLSLRHLHNSQYMG